MGIPGSLVERLSEHLSRHVGAYVDIERETPVGGGSINDAFRLSSSAGPFFVKVNAADRFQSMFAAEADGLQRLAATRALRVPRTISVGEDHDQTYILMEWIAEGPKGDRFWEGLGHGLAALHSHVGEQFGLERDNYIGTLKQPNSWCGTWHEFLIQRRWEPLIRLACDRGRLGMGDRLRAERLYSALPDLYPHEAPSLLHGDLWSGNILCTEDQEPVLIDPAVYNGHREVDLAMTLLFGGFSPIFYSAYESALPLAPDWRERTPLWQLYPLLVHLNLFGGGYRDQVTAVLKRYGSG